MNRAVTMSGLASIILTTGAYYIWSRLVTRALIRQLPKKLRKDISSGQVAYYLLAANKRPAEEALIERIPTESGSRLWTRRSLLANEDIEAAMRGYWGGVVPEGQAILERLTRKPMMMFSDFLPLSLSCVICACVLQM